jgi:hypothetical protein
MSIRRICYFWSVTTGELRYGNWPRSIFAAIISTWRAQDWSFGPLNQSFLFQSEFFNRQLLFGFRYGLLYSTFNEINYSELCFQINFRSRLVQSLLLNWWFVLLSILEREMFLKLQLCIQKIFMRFSLEKSCFTWIRSQYIWNFLGALLLDLTLFKLLNSIVLLM